jgi:hypothetical protein
VLARDRQRGLALVIGLGSLGVGVAWLEEERMAECHGFADAPEQDSGDADPLPVVNFDLR